MALDPSNSSSLEQLALKGLMLLMLSRDRAPNPTQLDKGRQFSVSRAVLDWRFFVELSSIYRRAVVTELTS